MRGDWCWPRGAVVCGGEAGKGEGEEGRNEGGKDELMCSIAGERNTEKRRKGKENM